MLCSGGTCQPTCTDGQKDGAETDVDCGGPVCPKCAIGKTCASAGDCVTGVNGEPTCTGSTCGFACSAGFADCNGGVGCATDITTTSNCGACGVTCSAYCVNGACNNPVAISNPAGYHHACAILQDGSVYCWGQNASGEVGDGTTTLRSSPTKVTLPYPATAVSGNGDGNAQTCAVLTDGSLWCWGDNAYGELGVGDANVHLGPQKVPLPNVAQVAVGGVHVCAVDTNQDLYCWGSNSYGEVGNGTPTYDVTTPTMITSSVVALAAGEEHACAVKTGGAVYCWGSNGAGELGDGTTNVNGASAPVAVPTVWLSSVATVAAGNEYTCARSGTVGYCWGMNDEGQLGLGNIMNQSVPAPLPQLTGVTQLVAGVYHAAALTSKGLYTWGGNQSGQLGDGTFTNNPVPTVVSFPDAATVALSWGDTCVITTGHVMSCWGDNTYGQLGDGTTSASSTPVAVVWPP